jgi:hypothetical protein
MKYSLSSIVPLLIISVILLQKEVYSATCVYTRYVGNSCTIDLCASPCNRMYPAAYNTDSGSTSVVYTSVFNNIAFFHHYENQ